MSPSKNNWPLGLQKYDKAAPFPILAFAARLLPALLFTFILSFLVFQLQQIANKQILYIQSDGKLATINLSGTFSRNLNIPNTFTPSQFNAQWSPSGDRIAIDNQKQIFIITPTQSVIISASLPIVPPAGGGLGLATQAWSANGQQLAVVRMNSNSNELQIVNLGQVNTVVTPTTQLDVNQPVSWHPWSPRVLATVNLPDAITKTIIMADGQNGQEIFTPPDGQGTRAGAIWSPAGDKIAYLANVTPTNSLPIEGFAGSIWIASLDGKNPIQLEAQTNNFGLRWSPDGDRIWFNRFVTETQTINWFVMTISGTQVTKLDNAPTYPLSSLGRNRAMFDFTALLSWSPNGEKVIFSSPANTSLKIPPRIFLANADGHNVREIPWSIDGSEVITARWHPNGRAIFVSGSKKSMELIWIDGGPSLGFLRGNFSIGFNPVIQP